MNRLQAYFFKNEFSFAARLLQWAFGLYFFLVGVKKLRVDGHFDPINGIVGFARSLSEGAMGTAILAREMPDVLLLGYGFLLPFAELGAGLLLLLHRHIRWAYLLIGLIYLSLLFGQMYSGNTGKIGTDYLPSLVALCIAVYAHQRASSA